MSAPAVVPSVTVHSHSGEARAALAAAGYAAEAPAMTAAANRCRRVTVNSADGLASVTYNFPGEWMVRWPRP